ncbi:hypothetical protein P7C70_g3499, partial [Phenoliferia sp. Uapishka_3]
MQQNDAKLESYALSDRTFTKARKDTHAFEAAVMDEVIILSRTIFRLGRSDDLHTTMTLNLMLDYDPEPDRLRERFTLQKATLISTKRCIEGFKKLGYGFMEDSMTGSKQGASAQRLAITDSWYNLNIIWSVTYREGREVKKETYGYPASYHAGPAITVYFGPPEKRRLRPNWQEALKVAMRGADRTRTEMAEDDWKCETKERREELKAILDIELTKLILAS